ncbi:hypothetical protein OROGR_012685 [Orobanche gracilis]
MEEEFQESEILFRESVEVEYGTNYDGGDCLLNSDRKPRDRRGKRRKMVKLSNKKNSVPINIPEVNVTRNAWFLPGFGGDDGEFVPPHIIIGRRVAGKVTAFSLCTGNGRTRKGRNMSEFRNSVLRMTGFLET